MESTDSSTGSQQLQLPPGFRFHPTDEELVVYYLNKKIASAPLSAAIIAEVDLYKFDPWELPGKIEFLTYTTSFVIIGEIINDRYVIQTRLRLEIRNGTSSARGRGSTRTGQGRTGRPRPGTGRPTGTDKPVMSGGGSQKVGVKKALVFYGGKPPKGMKTNWMMHEYRVVGCDFINKKGSLRLDDWVLCRIYKKNNADQHIHDVMGSMNPQTIAVGHHNFIENHQTLYQGMMNDVAMNPHLPTATALLPPMTPAGTKIFLADGATILSQPMLGDGVFGLQPYHHVNWYT